MNSFTSIVIEPNYCGREVSQAYRWAILNNFPYKRSKEYIVNAVPIATVKIYQKWLGKTVNPDYHPSWAKPISPNYLKIFDENDLEKGMFVKPLDEYKRFDGFVFLDETAPPSPPYFVTTAHNGYENEFRYYVSYGEVLAAEWYKGICECEAPEFPLNIPKDYCGAIDLGFRNNKLELIEAHHPFSCGWYGFFENFNKYLVWLFDGWTYLIFAQYPRGGFEIP